MKLGTQTGSVTNHILSRAVRGQPEPCYGMGCTILAWSDRNPATIINVKGNIIVVQEDRAYRTDSNGMSECQEYEFERDVYGGLYNFRQAKNGQWEEVRLNEDTGRFKKTNGAGLRIGEREKYHDFSF